jgi:hypothetical protein
MAITDFPIYTFPTKAATDPNALYLSLGSFWTQLFQERETIKGYTLGQAEEIIQRYYDLIEVIQSYSVKDIPVLHREKWYPLLIKKSEYDTVPLTFRATTDPEVSVFGPQPSTDAFYANAIFKFGFPKIPVAEVFTFEPPSDFKQFSVLTNRIISPSFIMVNEVDIRLNGNILVFNKDIFNQSDIPKLNLIGDDGIPVTFTNANGQEIEDQLIILWAYHAEFDKELLFNNFGYIFDLKLESDEFYKTILQKVVDLFVEGPTVRSIRSLACAFLGVTPIIEVTEEVVEIYSDTLYRYVITDKHVYKFNIYYNILPYIHVGTVLFAGDILADAAEYYDYVQSRDWWRNSLVPKIALSSTGKITKYPDMNFPSHLFVGTYNQQFIIKNDLELITKDANGNIHFPIHGSPEDVATFHRYLNDRMVVDETGATVTSKSLLAKKLGMTVATSTITNPLDFIFDNFFKHNTALIKFNFYSLDQARIFMGFFNIIKDMFPKHCYLMFYFDFSIPQETYSDCNGTSTYVYTVNGVTTTVNNMNCDGSQSSNGGTEGKIVPPSGATNNNAKFIETQFTFSKSIKWADSSTVTGNMFPINATDQCIGNQSTTPTDFNLHFIDGKPSSTIPVGKSNKEVRNLLLLDFS